MGIAEIAELLGMTRQGADKVVRTRPDFPSPEDVISAGRIWHRDLVEEWAHEKGRT
jgi:predicted DNA-binding transcriptional regulator AlpA